jgi:hypothetical protein
MYEKMLAAYDSMSKVIMSQNGHEDWATICTMGELDKARTQAYAWLLENRHLKAA